MPLTQTFFTVAHAVWWCIRWLPVILYGGLLGIIAMEVGIHYSPWIGGAILLAGWTILLEIATWIERRERTIMTCSLRAAAILYGTLAYLAEGGLRSYDIRLIEGEIEVRYRLPSLLEIATHDPETVPRTVWEISVEGY